MSCLPILVLAMGTALAHMLRADAATGGGPCGRTAGPAAARSPAVAQQRLFAPVTEADEAIATLRLAIKDMYARTGTPAEAWPDDDQDAVDPRKGGFAHATVLHAGARRETVCESATSCSAGNTNPVSYAPTKTTFPTWRSSCATSACQSPQFALTGVPN